MTSPSAAEQALRDGDPQAAIKPFDLNRDGFIAGEGAGAFILEEYEQAKARGAKIYCEVIGYGSSNDAYDMIQLHESGRGLKRAVNAALRKAQIDTRQSTEATESASSCKPEGQKRSNCTRASAGSAPRRT